jgi:copper resistance protein B
MAAAIAMALLFALPAKAHTPDAGPSAAAPFGAPVDDQHIWSHLLIDQLEGRIGDGNSFRWQGEAWAGTDTNRVRLRSEGAWTQKHGLEDGQQEIFYSRPVSTYFDLLLGGRYDLDSGPGRGWAAFGIEGLAPLFFHVAATGYVSDKGRFAAKLEGSYDLLITQRLILQPELEMNLYTMDDSARGIGSGLSDLDAGLRLRYELTRKFAPYIGVAYEKKFGKTADLAQAEGEDPDALRVTIGVRIWL